MKYLIALAVLALAGCGADGDPIRPEPPTTPKPGLTVSGQAQLFVGRLK